MDSPGLWTAVIWTVLDALDPTTWSRVNDAVTSLRVCMRDLARLCAWLWVCGMRDCAYRCGRVDCAIVCVAVGVWNLRLCAWLLECEVRVCMHWWRSTLSCGCVSKSFLVWECRSVYVCVCWLSIIFLNSEFNSFYILWMDHKGMWVLERVVCAWVCRVH